MENMDTFPRVLSIQSHVVSGYVGNKSATFPLQLLGFDVDPINSVQFSCHTKYKVWKGQVLNEVEVSELHDGLRANDIDRYSHILTGYVYSDAMLKKVVEIIAELRKVNPDVIYVCDPVLGDNGKLYVPENVVSVYRDYVVPLATVLTPNQFEAELLTGITISSESDTLAAIDKLHSMGSKVVVISSSCSDDGDLVCFVSNHETGDKFRISFPKSELIFTGTGDLFSALILAWMYKLNGDWKTIIENVISTVQGVMQNTVQFAEGMRDPNAQDVRKMELRIIQSKGLIENPPSFISAERILGRAQQ